MRTGSECRAAAAPYPRPSASAQHRTRPGRVSAARHGRARVLSIDSPRVITGVSNVDATKALTWDDGAPLVLGASFALPVALGMALLFLPDPRPSPPMSIKDLKVTRG